MNYVAYYRVSTQKQGLGLEAQRTTVMNYLHDTDTIVSEYSEKESGKDNDRPQLTKALAECKKSGATLLIAKLDRLSRNVAFLFTLKDSGTKFVACDMPLFDTMTLAIYAGIAQKERELISERTKKALAELKAKGVKLGKPGATFTDDMRSKAYQAHTESAKADKSNKIAWAVICGQLDRSYNDLARILNDAGINTPRGGQWRGNQVKRVVELYRVVD